MYRTERWGFTGSLVAGEGSGGTTHGRHHVRRYSNKVLVLTRGGCTTIAQHRASSYFDLVLASARWGVNVVHRSVVQEEVMFLWPQVPLRFGKALGNEMALLQAVQTKTSTLNKDSSLSHSQGLTFFAIGQLVGCLAIHTFNWVACTS